MDIVAELNQTVSAYLASNQFASGGLVIGLTGAGLALVRSLPRRLAMWAWKQVTVEIEIESENSLFYAVEFLMSTSSKLTRQRTYRAKYLDRAPSVSWGDPGDCAGELSEQSDAEKLGVILSPGIGRHWLRIGRRLFLVSRTSKEDKLRTLEAFSIHAMARDVAAIRDLLEQAVSACTKPEEKHLSILTVRSGSWRSGSKQPVRKPNSVILKAGLLEDLADDVRAFYGRKSWYENVGVPYRRGYLLVGPPGNGKTSTVSVLAGMFGATVCVLDLSDALLSNQGLLSLLADAPRGAFILLEDIDAMFKAGVAQRSKPTRRDEVTISEGPARESAEASNGITFSGLLNALDGVATPEGRLVFMSTNHPEKLDPALIRPGRIDRVVQFDNADADQAERMVKRFFGDSVDREFVSRFAAAAGNGGHSMASIQAALVQCGDNHEEAYRLLGEHGNLDKKARVA